MHDKNKLKMNQGERRTPTPCCPVHVLQLPACHGEDADHQVDAPVAQQRHLRFIPMALLGFLLGLDGGPDADGEHQQVEEHHDGHAGDVESHDGADVWVAEPSGECLPGCWMMQRVAPRCPQQRDPPVAAVGTASAYACASVCVCARVCVRHDRRITMCFCFFTKSRTILSHDNTELKLELCFY